MSDGGQQQRVLDLIDDPNALESFLGGLTSDSELLPSAESVDNVVASLQRSLESDYEVDSPNETLFEALEGSTNNLTDISQSYVPSDFENAIANANAMSLSNGEISHHHIIQQQQQQIVTSGVDQFLMSSSQTISQQYSNNSCDSSSQFLQQNQIQMNQNQQQTILDNANNSNNNNNNVTSYSFSQELLQQKQTTTTAATSIHVNNNNNQQIPTSLSSSTTVDSSSSSLNQSISSSSSSSSSSMPCNQNNNGQFVNAFQQNDGQLQQIVNNNNISNLINSSISSTNNSDNVNNISNNISNNNNSTSNSISVSSSSIIHTTQQQQQQFIQQSSTQQQQATINQLVSAGQTVSLANVSVGGHQLLATSTGNIMTTGQVNNTANLIQQIQAAGGGQSYITVDHHHQPTATALIAGPGAFGGANLALLATGSVNQPTYAVVNTGTQFLSNATIMAQPQAFQTLTKGPNGTYYQTTTTGGTTQLVATSNVGQIHHQNVNVSVANSPNNNVVNLNSNTNNAGNKPKQLLPKPQSSASPSITENDFNNSSSTSTNSTGSQNTISVNTSDGVTQIFHQHPQQSIQGHQVVVTSVGNTVIPQQSFSIGGGQVVMSQNPNQQQLTGTIVVNQYGQPMLVPSAGQQGIQFIVRPQQQVLTLQAQPGQANGKPVVRYVSQMPQMTQTQGYGLQQIQTANGPAWVAVRYPQPTLTTTSGQFSQLQTDSNIITSQTAQIPTSQQQQVQQQVVPQPVSSTPTPPPPSTTPTTTNTLTQNSRPNTPKQPATPKTPQQKSHPSNSSNNPTPDSSSEPPKKPKSKPKPNKKKQTVTLDLEQLLKQSGIMDEDLQDDASFDFGFSTSQDSMVPQNGFESGDFLQMSSSTDSSPMKNNSIQDPGVNSSGNKAKGKGGYNGGRKRPSSDSGSGVSVVSGSGSKKKKKRRSPTPPPPPPPPSKSRPKKKGGSNNNSGTSSSSGGGNKKAVEPNNKTEFTPNRKVDGVKTVSSLDSITATIDAVARSASSPSPPSSPSSSLPLSSPAQPSTPMTPSSPATNSSIKQPSNNQSSAPNTPNSNSVTSSFPNTNGINNNNNINLNLPMASLASNHHHPTSTTTRIVQTIQLTPQNQQLLRNIQAQITRLLSLTKRNDTEQTALQKLIVLQQQVIATGIPVPNPTHLNNLAQNTISNNITLPSTTIPIPVSTAPSSSEDTILASTPAIINPKNIFSTSTPTNNVNSQQMTLSTSNNNSNSVKILPKIISSLSEEPPENDLSGSFIETMAKVVVDNGESGGITEENKENATGINSASSSSMVVSSSAFSSGTNTTNALGQHQVQSFKSSTDDKKPEDQRLAIFKVEEEKRSRWKKEEFEMLLKRDQQCVTQPDYEIPFTDKRDAVERLMKYHILRDRNDMNFEEFDNEFSEKSVVLLDKFSGMVSKYRSLLLKESMREVGCAERVMLERMFVTEEKLKMEQDRLLVNQGEVLELPHPPTSWIPTIQEMVEKEMKEMEQDSYVNMQVQSAIDSIIGFGGNLDQLNGISDEGEIKIEYDAFGVPINNNNGGFINTSSADIDEAVRSIMM